MTTSQNAKLKKRSGNPKGNLNARGPKPTRKMTKLVKAKSPKASIKRKSHAAGAHALAGSGERLLMCRRMAFEYRMDGMTLRESAMKIADEMNLEKVPEESTVHAWVMEATSNIVGEMTELAKEWLPVLVGRQEKMVQRYLPMALGGLHIKREIKQDGQTVQVIDESAYAEQLKAADFVRKSIETTAKLLGIGMNKESSDDLPGGLRGIQLALIQKHETHIHMPGQALPAGEGIVLTMESGDVEIDNLDAKRLAAEGV